jgi:hypothetical protein
LIIESSVSNSADTYISSANPTVSYRTSDLSLSTISTTNKIVTQFVLPSTIDPDTIISASISINPKTLSGSNTNYSIKTALLSGSLDYRFVTWNNYASVTPWTTPGGDISSDDSISTSPALTHSVGSRVKIDCTRTILYVYSIAKIYTQQFLIWTEESNVNTTYYSLETAGNAPVLLITQKEPHTGDRMGRNTSIISVPSI